MLSSSAASGRAVKNMIESWFQEIAIGGLAITNAMILFFVRRFIARFDSLVTSVQSLSICVAKQTARWESLEQRLKEMREDRIKDQADIWRAIEQVRNKQ